MPSLSEGKKPRVEKNGGGAPQPSKNVSSS
jgi:hypothetical protein